MADSIRDDLVKLKQLCSEGRGVDLRLQLIARVLLDMYDRIEGRPTAPRQDPDHV